MNFRIVRDHMNLTPTTGQLLAGDLSLYTLELPWKDDAPKVSCIPVGNYRTILAWSNRFQRLMPRLMDVPGRTGILVHSGNTVANTEGCILVGMRFLSPEVLIESRSAFGLFFSWLGESVRDGDVYCKIEVADSSQ